jgi:hypothetical protein
MGTRPTEEKGLVRVAVNKTLDWRVSSLVEGIQGKSGVVGLHDGPGRNKLAEDGIVQRVIPVHSAQDVRPVPVSAPRPRCQADPPLSLGGGLWE